MGSIGKTGPLSLNELMTYDRARAALDLYFFQLREDGLQQIAAQTPDGDPCAWDIWCQIVNGKWTRAAVALEKKLLPRKSKGRYYRPVATVNPGGKTKPRNSITQARRQHRTRKLRGYRSHHKGHYISQGRRGRPQKWFDERKRALARHYKRLPMYAAARKLTAQQRKLRGWKRYHRKSGRGQWKYPTPH